MRELFTRHIAAGVWHSEVPRAARRERERTPESHSRHSFPHIISAVFLLSHLPFVLFIFFSLYHQTFNIYSQTFDIHFRNSRRLGTKGSSRKIFPEEIKWQKITTNSRRTVSTYLYAYMGALYMYTLKFIRFIIFCFFLPICKNPKGVSLRGSFPRS